MEISREVLFFFSAIGAFNGILLGLYFLIFARPKHISNYFLGAFLISLSIRIGKSVFFYFNEDLSFAYLQLGLTACIFIGPFLYFYFSSIVNKENKTVKNWFVHILILLVGMTYINFKYPFEYNIDIWRPSIINGIYYVWLGYTVAAGVQLYKFLTKGTISIRNLEKTEIWLVSLFVGNVIIWMAYYFCGVMSYILGALLFSFMLYILVLFLIFNKKKDFVKTKVAVSYKDKKIQDEKADQLIEKLNSLMKEESLYKSSNIKMPDVANRLKIPTHTLSQLLNDNVGKGFPQFLNEYRIEEAKRMIKTTPEYTLESIGYECGFNSKSAFYAAFKKIVETTPAAYQKSLNLNGK